MKRLAILFFIGTLLTFGNKVEAQGQFSETLTKMENSLLGMDYKNQSDNERANRLEEFVYGSTSSKPIQQRVSKLSTDLSADLIGKEIKPKKDTFEDNEDNNLEEPIPKEDKNISYPMVDALERAAFDREFKGTDVKQRLTNLEQKVFKKAYNDDLNARVERLKSAIMPSSKSIAQSDTNDDSDNLYVPDDDNATNNQDNLSNNNYFSRGQNQLQPSYNQNPSVLDSYDGDSDIIVPLGSLEKQILKRTYPNDAVSTRLVRLETKVFKSTFTEDDEQTRLGRIASAYQAQKTSKRYDNNKTAQHVATAMQIGAFLLMILAAVL